ncbi:MAG: hypothetical protein QNL03_04145 [Gammaproteobacteria bacterium]|nr:hypothetical protein [Gammaproteobacteria bacterium]
MHLDPVMPYLAIRRMLGDNWRDSLYAAAFLSQIDEFSFVRRAGIQSTIISNYG